MTTKIPTVVSILILHLGMAQSFPGFSGDNFNGTYGLITNPANIADSRLKMDINLISGNFLGGTDYIALNSKNFNGFINGFSFDDTPNRNLSNTVEVLANEDYIGPSFTYALDDLNSIGFFSRIRKLYNYNNINGRLFETTINGAAGEDFSFDQNNIDTSVHMWGEFGFSYGRVLLDKGNHFFKTGATLKLLLGSGSAQLQSNTLSGDYGDGLLNLAGDISYVTSFGNEAPNFTLSQLAPGISADVGFVYEFRPDAARSMAAYEGERERNKYKFKIGVALLDYGEITYKDQQRTEYTELDGTVAAAEFETANLAEVLTDNFEPNGITREGSLTVALPTSLQINIDYKAYRDIYLNVEYNQTMVDKIKFYNNNRINHLTITPRYERKNIAAYFPISFSPLGDASLGAGIRVGPVVIGSGSILSNLIMKNPNNINVFAAVRLIRHHVGRRR